MAISPTSPVTGATVTGLTTPTYTLTQDQAPSSNGKQWFVSAIGGTQTGVDLHSISKPFTFSFYRPPVLRTLPPVNPITGIMKNVPYNNYKAITRKAASPAVNQIPLTNMISTEFRIAAGTETYEPEDLAAMISFHIGVLNQLADSILSAGKTGSI